MPPWILHLCRPASRRITASAATNTCAVCSADRPARCPNFPPTTRPGGLVDAVINQGLPAPIDIQIKSQNMEKLVRPGAAIVGARSSSLPTVRNVYIPQSIDYPGLALDIDRERASLVGLTAKDVVDDVITALTSDGMVAPSYWIDPKSGNNYLVTVQYANRWINHMSMEDLKNIPLRGSRPAGLQPHGARRAGCSHERCAVPQRSTVRATFTLGSVADIRQINTPTEVDHNQIRRVIDIYVSPKSEALQKASAHRSTQLLANTQHDKNTVHRCARRGGQHERVVQGLRPRPHHRHRARLSDPHGPVRFVHRSVHHPHGHPAGSRRRGADPLSSPEAPSTSCR